MPYSYTFVSHYGKVKMFIGIVKYVNFYVLEKPEAGDKLHKK